MTRIIARAGVAALLSGGPRRGPGPDGPPPPPPSKGAHVILERGDARIDLKCADDDSTRACADIALQLVDRLATLRPEAR